MVACDERNIEDVDDNKLAARVRNLRRKPAWKTSSPTSSSIICRRCTNSQQEGLQGYLEEVKTWRAAHKANSERCYGYQALTMEYAKNLLEIGDKEADKKAQTTQALTLLGEMVKIPSPYQQDAIELRRQLNPNGYDGKGFRRRRGRRRCRDGEEEMGRGHRELRKGHCGQRPPRPIRAPGRREEHAGRLLPQPGHAALPEEQDRGSHRHGQEGLEEGESANQGRAGLAVFLLNVQYYQYLARRRAPKRRKRPRPNCSPRSPRPPNRSSKDWAAKEEGDSARIILLRLALAQDNMAEADKILSEINPESKEYPKALTVMGFAHWFKYKTAKKQLEADKDKDG